MHRLLLVSVNVVNLLLALTPTVGQAQSFHEDFSIWPIDLTINGTVMACAGPEVEPSVVDRFMARGGGEDGKFVAICLDHGIQDNAFQSLLDRADGVEKFGSETDLPSDSSSADFKSIKKSIQSARGVLLLSSRHLSLDARRTVLSLRDDLHETITKGGVVCGLGPVASYFGRFQHEPIPELSSFCKGLDLIPDSIVYTNYKDQLDRLGLNSAVSFEPYCVGIGIPRETAIVLQGRKIRTYGKGEATFTIAANDRQSFRVQRLAQRQSRRTSPYDSVVDLTAWRRDAIDRQLPVFPPTNPPTPKVENGTLFIVGGGGIPRGMMEEFVELAGGDKARMIYVPCTESKTVSPDQRIIRQWQAMGVASAHVFHTKNRNQANTDEAFLEPLSKATGIWFGGGRQWNFVDSYYGTKAHKLMKDVLKRGGVIGGSSAGASVQGDYLARANPVANFDIMAPGYERGLGFLTGVAIDQHFSQRRRQKDMTQLANRYPQLLGIGIDETTAIKVQGSIAEVIGRGKVFFYDRRKPVIPGNDDFVAVSAEQKFDLAQRKIVAVESESEVEPDQ